MNNAAVHGDTPHQTRRSKFIYNIMKHASNINQIDSKKALRSQLIHTLLSKIPPSCRKYENYTEKQTYLNENYISKPLQHYTQSVASPPLPIPDQVLYQNFSKDQLLEISDNTNFYLKSIKDPISLFDAKIKVEEEIITEKINLDKVKYSYNQGTKAVGGKILLPNKEIKEL